MLPGEWLLVIYEQAKDQFETMRKILNRKFSNVLPDRLLTRAASL
jgi:hypothetical protein